MQLCENEENDFSVSYPSGWTAEELDPDELDIVAGFLAPGKDIGSLSVYIAV
jgi:hypothetical protein